MTGMKNLLRVKQSRKLLFLKTKIYYVLTKIHVSKA